MTTSLALARLAPAALLGAALSLSSTSTGIAAGEDCAAASRALEQAQQQLSKATRDADTRADAYHRCMQKSGACAQQKAAYDAALSARSKASAAVKSAIARRKKACH